MPSSPPTPISQLIGTWRLLVWRIQYSDQRADTYPFGQAASGLIMYTTDGYMSACIAQADRKPLSSASVRSADVAEQVAAFGSYFQYAGRYRVEAAPQSPSGWQVVHTVEQSLNPNFVGTEQRRDMTWHHDGSLSLSASDSLPGAPHISRLHTLHWQRT